MNSHCELYGHYWGHGPVSGVLVCCRQRCIAQAVCVVCVGGMVPTGFERAYCPMHQPRSLECVAHQRKHGKPLAAPATQDGLW